MSKVDFTNILQTTRKLLWLFLLFPFTALSAQYNKGPINSYSYALLRDADTNPESMIRNGAQAFEINNELHLKKMIAICNKHLQNHKTVFYFILKDSRCKNFESIFNSEAASRLYTFSRLPWPTEKKLIETKKNFVLICEKKIQTIKSLKEKYNGHSDFIKLTNFNGSGLKKDLYTFWETGAHPVNFISCSSDDFKKVQPTLMALNATSRISGSFTLNGKPTNGIRFNNDNNKLENTQFCLPFSEKIKLSLYKDGYELSPQVISAYYSSEYYYADITAYPVPINTKLIYKLSAGEKDSLPGGENGSIINKGVKTTELQNEKILHFNGKSYISFKPSKSADSLLNMSYAFRFRLNSSDRFQTIVSQGSIFDIKIFDNHLCFTLPEQKAYRFPKFRIENNRWYNVCVTISNGNNLRVYCDNKLIDTCTIKETASSSEYFMIGNNIYQEHLNGDIKSIRIWNRALSETDIDKLWIKDQPALAHKWAWAFILILPTAFGAIFLLHKKKKKTALKTKHSIQPIISEPEIHPNHRVESRLSFFGNFSLVDANKNDITTEMYPKVKQLFLLIALHSINDNGISTRDLNDILWPGMNETAAKNNRGVTIQNLRQILSNTSGLQVNFHNKCWIIDGLEDIYVDYIHCQSLIARLQTDITKMQVVTEFIDLVSSPFLKDSPYEFADTFKAKLNESLLDLLLKISTSPIYKDNPELLLKISNALFAIDEVNEEALEIRIHAYRLLKNETMVRISQENFDKKYLAIYNEPYMASRSN